MKNAIIFFLLQLLAGISLGQQKFSVEKDLKKDWMKFENSEYKLLEDETDVQNTIYLKMDADHFPGSFLSIQSARSYFVFINGKLSGEHHGRSIFRLDSLATIYYSPSFFVAIHQPDINPRDLKTTIVSPEKKISSSEPDLRPKTFFKDFVILSGLIITVMFVVIMRVNPKLSSDYFSVVRIFSMREADDAQSNARLTSSSNILFYIICSLLLGFYMMIILKHLPDQYALPVYFKGDDFWSIIWQWLRISLIILATFFIKILLVFSFTRLFGMRGLARVHFFNWVRLLLIVFGASSIILFIYFISRGQDAYFFTLFLALVIGTLTAWIFVVFLKLNGKSEHSMFHLFSYICATEIIPLLITIKVLFQ